MHAGGAHWGGARWEGQVVGARGRPGSAHKGWCTLVVHTAETVPGPTGAHWEFSCDWSQRKRHCAPLGGAQCAPLGDSQRRPIW
eukprot:3797153-Pyramimonas_sp.AAC.1